MSQHIVDLNSISIDDIGLGEIDQLVRDSAEETQTLEFKAACPANWNDQSKAEVRKDVVAMANAQGGTILYGVAETNNSADELTPIVDGQELRTRLEDILSSCIEPPLGGIQFKIIQSDEGGDVLVLRMLPSVRGPHCVKTNDWNLRFPIRIGRRIRSMSIVEIRDAFLYEPVARDVSRIREYMERTDARNLSVESLSTPQLLGVNDPDQFLAEACRRDVSATTSRATFWCGVVPTPLELNEPLLKRRSELDVMVAHLPGSRRSGWFIDGRVQAKPSQRGIEFIDEFDAMGLVIWWNGAVTFYGLLDTGIATWGYENLANAVGPVLNTLALSEPAVRTVELGSKVGALLNRVDEYRVHMGLYNASNLMLTPYSSRSNAIRHGYYQSNDDIIRQIPGDNVEVRSNGVRNECMTSSTVQELIKQLFVKCGFVDLTFSLPYFERSGEFQINS